MGKPAPYKYIDIDIDITEELLEWKSSSSGSRKTRLKAVKIHCVENATHSIRKSWH
jgi:hypothetical protein